MKSGMSVQVDTLNRLGRYAWSEHCRSEAWTTAESRVTPAAAICRIFYNNRQSGKGWIASRGMKAVGSVDFPVADVGTKGMVTSCGNPHCYSW